VAQLLGDDVAKKLFPEFRPPAGQRSDGLLSVQDWSDIQEIWKVIGSQWKDIQKTHERMFGFSPRGVDPEPFTVTVGGRVVQLDGGYYPVIYDPELSARAGAYTEREDILARTDAIYAAPAARRGFTKERADGGAGMPVKLRTSVIPQHLRDVTRFIELAETVRFADRVISSENWKDGYVRAFGTEQYKAVRPNLKGVVLEENPPREALNQIAEKLRKPLVVWGLSWNLKTAMLQSTALFPAMGDLGAGNVLHGVKTLATGRYGLVKQIWEMTPYMKNRAQNIDQDLRKAVGGIDAKTREKVVKLLGKELTWEKVVDAGMLPLLSVDMATSCAIWVAGYNREMSRLMGEGAGKRGIDPTSQYHKAAALAADMAVKAVNPDYNPSSRSAFLRDKKGMARLVNMFASAVVLFAQRRAYSAQALKHGKMSLGEYARYEAYDFMLPGVAMGLLLALARGEDEEEGAKEIAKSVLGTAAMRVPLGGSLLETMITGESWQRGTSTVFDQPWRLATRLRSAGDDAEKWAWALADIISFTLRVPVSRVARNAVKGHEQWERGEGTPLSLVMPRPGK
jgi:hypothetical protein